MSTRVYQYGLLPPTAHASLVRETLAKAHAYRNKLTEIERARRAAVRALFATPEIVEAEASLKAATRSDRKERLRALARLRSEQLRAKSVELAALNEAAALSRKTARAACGVYWGTYLLAEAAADAARQAPLYDRDGLTPSDPSFERFTGAGNLGAQIQNGMPVRDLLEGKDTRARLVLDPRVLARGRRYGKLSLRVASEGRAPVFAVWPIKLHRALPDAAKISWVRVSCRIEGPFERWTVEITLDDPAPRARELATNLRGMVAVEACWEEHAVAHTRDDAGHEGHPALPERIRTELEKASGIRAVRDLLLEDFRGHFVRAVHALGAKGLAALPPAVREQIGSAEVWKGPSRFVALREAWYHALGTSVPAFVQYRKGEWVRTPVPGPGMNPLEALEAWYQRDEHLWRYETGVRRKALRYRRECYRCLAASLAKRYRTLVLDDRDLSREARFGDEGSARFATSPSELREALREAFGDDVIVHRYKSESADDERPWCERAIEGARTCENTKKKPRTKGGAWAARKAKKTTAREALDKPAEERTISETG